MFFNVSPFNYLLGHSEKNWFSTNFTIPDFLDVTPLDNQSFQLFKNMLWNQPASAITTTCGNLSSHQISMLTCNRWLTEDILQNLSDVLNQRSRDCLCIVLSEYNKTRSHKAVLAAAEGKENVRLAFLILNVSVNQLLQTTMVSNKLLTGNHWVVAVIDVCAETTYYCDPLGFPIPINLSVETQQVSLELKRVLSKQMKMFYHTIAMHKPMFGPNSEHICSRIV